MAPVPPAILTIFGITGDLAHRKLLPALYALAKDQLLPKEFKIVGVTRRGTTPEAVIEHVKQAVNDQGKQCDPEVLNRLQVAISIVTMDITEGNEYLKLKRELDAIEESFGVCLNRLFYLAIPGQMFAPIIRLLATGRLNSGCQHNRAESRLLIEKPVGSDLSSATELLETIDQAFTENQLYLIDHYLAKPMVQQFLDWRLKDERFDHMWQATAVERLIVRADEAIGIEGRRVFYEEMGALRDVLQSHLIQLLALVTMDRPTDNSAEAIHTAKQTLLKTVQPPTADKLPALSVRGQYQGYQEEVGNAGSNVETFAAVVLQAETTRWQGVPMLLQTGKQLKAKRTEIQAILKPGRQVTPGSMTVAIEPEGPITLQTGDRTETLVKPPAKGMEAYEHVLVDAMRGDRRFFATQAEVLAGWRIVTPILQCWADNHVPLLSYQPGSDGPPGAAKLLT